MTQTRHDDPRKLLQRARAVMICPRVFKAGFFFGGEGGACVLLARAGNGTWSYPAFYGMGSGSFGLQIGIQDAQFIMMIMTEKGLRAILDSQFKFGADASLAIATIGAGIQGSTTSALGRRHRRVLADPRPVWRHLAGRQPDGPAQQLEPRLLRPRDGQRSRSSSICRGPIPAPIRCATC